MTDRTPDLHHFHGGLRLPGHKAISTRQPLRRVPMPRRLILPVHQHIGEPAKVVVRTGERVYKGQVIARGKSYISAPVHASSSGIVVDIGQHPVPYPSGLSGECVVIETDGEDQWLPQRLPPMPDFRNQERAEIRLRVRECGIVGLGGAAFPTAVKLNPRPRQEIHTLILNGAECEPYISCDDTLMREHPEQVLIGAQIMRHALRGARCIIAIEEDMPKSIAAMTAALRASPAEGITIVTVPTRYPTGGERQLIKVLTNEEVPSDGLPADIGMVCHNVGTAHAVQRAVLQGEPLISRIVTVTGQGVAEPGNLEVPLGMPVSELVAAAGGYTEGVERLIMGGPMMGFALNTDEVPVTKGSNCLLAATAAELAPPTNPLPCIRCGACVEVCPAQLLPQELYWHARSKALNKTLEYNLFDCIECGCCAYVCPSHIPLVQYYRYAKSEIWNQERQQEAAERARHRHEFHLERLAREKAERAVRLARKKAAISKAKDSEPAAKDAMIRAAVDRAKAHKASVRHHATVNRDAQEGGGGETTADVPRKAP